MLSRAQVFGLINIERAYQDAVFAPELTTSCGQTRADRDLSPAPGILMLEEYAAKARAAWVNNHDSDDLPALQQVAKIAAIAVRILETVGDSERLLRAGLR